MAITMGQRVSDFTGNRSWLIAAVAIAAMAAMPPAHSDAKSLAGLIDAVVAHGPDSRLPAHLSVVLGVSKIEQETAVKQAVIRDGQTVHTFNVCAAKHDDIVIMSVNEREHTTRAYLVSAAGVLRKAVSYQAGAPAIERSLAEARADFANEMKFWTDIERRQAGSK
jgi:hypothetical protein